MGGVLKPVIRFGRRVFDRLERTLEEIADDPQLQTALEADLGLPPGALDKAKVTHPDPALQQYLSAADPKAEQLKVTFDAIKDLHQVLDHGVRRGEDRGPVDRRRRAALLPAPDHDRRPDQVRLSDRLRADPPRGGDRAGHAADARGRVRPGDPREHLQGHYFKAWYEQFEPNYLRFRLDQAPDLKDPNLPLSLRDRQLSLRAFALSDAGLIAVAILAKYVPQLDHFYGWELPPRAPAPLCGTQPPGTGIPLSDHVASRASTLRLPLGASSATLTHALLEDAQGRLGWLLSLGGSGTITERFGPTSPVSCPRSTPAAAPGSGSR